MKHLPSYLHAALLAAAAGQIYPIENQLSTTLNDTLSTFASAYAADALGQSLLNWMAPVVPTFGAHSGQYKEYKTGDALRVYDLETSNGVRQEVAWSATDPYFNLTPLGLQTRVTEEDASQPGNIAQDKVANMLDIFFRSREVRGLAKLKAAVAATGGLGAWLTDDAVDPIKQFNAEQEKIATNNGGLLPNRWLLPLKVYQRIIDHPLVKGRFSGISAEINMDQLKKLLLNSAMEIKLGTMSAETSARGKTSAKASVYGLDSWMFYASDKPNRSDVSAFKTFSDVDLTQAKIRSYIEHGDTEVFFVKGSEQIICTADVSVSRITVS